MFSYSKDGLAAAYRYESAFRQVFWLNLILAVLALFLDFGPAIRVMLVATSFILLITELLNTAVKAAVDRTSTEKHELAKCAKDADSTAQPTALSMLFIVWIIALAAQKCDNMVIRQDWIALINLYQDFQTAFGCKMKAVYPSHLANARSKT